MSTLQWADLKVNAGKPKEEETPLWKGKTTFKIGGKPLVAAVSRNQEWFWVRFEGMDEPLPPELHAQMTNASFYWAKKARNLGYFGESNQAKVRMLRELGFSGAQHLERSPVAPVAAINGNVTHPANTPAKGTKTTTPAPIEPTYTPTLKEKKMTVNAAGRIIDSSNGRFVGMDEVTANGTPTPQGDTTPAGTDEEATDAYQFGWEYGRYARNHGFNLQEDWNRGYEDGNAPDPVVTPEDTQLRDALVTVATAMVGIQELLAKLIK